MQNRNKVGDSVMPKMGSGISVTVVNNSGEFVHLTQVCVGKFLAKNCGKKELGTLFERA